MQHGRQETQFPSTGTLQNASGGSVQHGNPPQELLLDVQGTGLQSDMSIVTAVGTWCAEAPDKQMLQSGSVPVQTAAHLLPKLLLDAAEELGAPKLLCALLIANKHFFNLIYVDYRGRHGLCHLKYLQGRHKSCTEACMAVSQLSLGQGAGNSMQRCASGTSGREHANQRAKSSLVQP